MSSMNLAESQGTAATLGDAHMN